MNVKYKYDDDGLIYENEDEIFQLCEESVAENEELLQKVMNETFSFSTIFDSLPNVMKTDIFWTAVEQYKKEHFVEYKE